MKKILMILTMVLVVSGCSQTGKDDQKIQVYTTFYVMSEFARVVGGDRVTINQLLSDGGDAHNYEPSTQDIAKVAQADLFVYNSEHLEHYAQEIIQSAANDDLVVVEAARDIELLASDHGLDPHTWLSLANAKTELQTILAALIETDPQNADYYQANYDKYILDLEELDQRYQAELAPYALREIVVEHEAFAYLCADYQITQKSVTGITGEGEATAKQIKEAIDYINSEQIAVLFYQEELNEKVMAMISQETQSELLPLSTIAALSQEDIQDGANYLVMMEQNLENIVYALDQIN